MMMDLVPATLVALAACSNGSAARDTVEFYGIVVEVPVGTSSASSGSHLPMNYEGAPTEVTPGITFSHPTAKDFALEIKKLPAQVSLDGMKWTMGQQKQASNVVGRVTPAGWDVEYRWQNEGAQPVTIYVRYLQLDAEQYECQYDEGASKRLDIAEAICRSMRVKPTAKSPPPTEVPGAG